VELQPILQRVLWALHGNVVSLLVHPKVEVTATKMGPHQRIAFWLFYKLFKDLWMPNYGYRTLSVQKTKGGLPSWHGRSDQDGNNNKRSIPAISLKACLHLHKTETPNSMSL
jgi:hypothetical protein